VAKEFCRSASDLVLGLTASHIHPSGRDLDFIGDQIAVEMLDHPFFKIFPKSDKKNE